VGAVEESDLEQWLDDAGSPDADPQLRVQGPRVMHPDSGEPGARLTVCARDDATLLLGNNRSSGRDADVAYSLFAYPLCENYAGAMYPGRWARSVRSLSTPKHRWLTLLDVAATVPHHAVNLRELAPDFAILSFYKIFGCVERACAHRTLRLPPWVLARVSVTCLPTRPPAHLSVRHRMPTGVGALLVRRQVEHLLTPVSDELPPRLCLQ
jgi:hypothetical protein